MVTSGPSPQIILHIGAVFIAAESCPYLEDSGSLEFFTLLVGFTLLFSWAVPERYKLRFHATARVAVESIHLTLDWWDSFRTQPVHLRPNRCSKATNHHGRLSQIRFSNGYIQLLSFLIVGRLTGKESRKVWEEIGVLSDTKAGLRIIVSPPECTN